MTLSDSSSTRTSGSWRPWRSRALLLTALVAVSLLVYQYRPHVGDARRVILALTAAGFFLAPLSTCPLRLALWLPAVAAVAWGGRMAGAAQPGRGALALWLLCSVAGAALAIRAGGRLLLAGSGKRRRVRPSARHPPKPASGVFCFRHRVRVGRDRLVPVLAHGLVPGRRDALPALSAATIQVSASPRHALSERSGSSGLRRFAKSGPF